MPASDSYARSETHAGWPTPREDLPDEAELGQTELDHQNMRPMTNGVDFLAANPPGPFDRATNGTHRAGSANGMRSGPHHHSTWSRVRLVFGQRQKLQAQSGETACKSHQADAGDANP